jgi:hypothetical protein
VTRAAKPRSARTTKARVASEKVRTAPSDARAAALALIIAKIQANGVATLHGIALALYARGVRTANGTR